MAPRPHDERPDLEEDAFEAVVDAVTAPQVPKPGWFAQARRNAEARQAFLDEVGALSSEEVATLAGSRATNRRSTATRWQAEGRTFAVTHAGRTIYPGFQFDPATGLPKPRGRAGARRPALRDVRLGARAVVGHPARRARLGTAPRPAR